MRVAVASGKGGTGKTLVATSLALVAAESGRTALLDADVEAPNAGLFLDATMGEPRPVEQMTPQVDQDVCIHCGRCAEVCQYNAIASLLTTTLVFGEICHGCGSCTLNCPVQAISETPRPVGEIVSGWAGELAFSQGTLHLGEVMAPLVIRQLKRQAAQTGWNAYEWVVIDSPPGTSCPVVETLRGADVALLVTEPTPFGLHDLKMAVEVARGVLAMPLAVAINKDGGADTEVVAYCQQEGIPIVLRLPLRREIATAYSTGLPLVDAFPEYRPVFRMILDRLAELAGKGQS